MTQPTSYTPTVNFQQEETNAVAGRSTVRTSAIDVEHNNIATTLAGILTNLALIQRDDTKLLDDIVELHTLHAEVLALIASGAFTMRGAWVTATAYVKGDIVSEAAVAYLCLEAHTAGVFATDLAAGKWGSLTITAAHIESLLATVEPPAQFLRKNILINGGFTVNQRVYVSAAVLASGAYGHDRWKGGASGGNYSFAQLNHNTVITIAAGKSLIQVVENKNVKGGSYILSWSGTAQARAGVDSATPSGAYSASPLVIAGQSAGTVMSVEFNEGTLGAVQLELGSVATEFEQRNYHDEFRLCARYYQRQYATALDPIFGAGHIPSAGTFKAYCPFPFGEMRTTPTITNNASLFVDSGAVSAGGSGTSFANLSTFGASWSGGAAGTTAGNGCIVRLGTTLTTYWEMSAEL
jgi:hypothetical protein